MPATLSEVSTNWSRPPKSTRRQLSAAHAAGVREECAEFRIGQGTREREHSRDEPGQQQPPRRADRLRHRGRFQKNASANDRADHESGGVAEAKAPDEFGLGHEEARERGVRAWTGQAFKPARIVLWREFALAA